MKCSILVVLYGCEIKESRTISSILSSSFDFSGFNLVVWNNGPNHILTVDCELLKLKGFNVFLIETIENRSIAKIYNEFIDSYPSDRYVFLDHDSMLGDSYLSEVLCRREVGIGVPVVRSKSVVRSPVVNGKFHGGAYGASDRVRAVGSGLVLSAGMVSVIKNKFTTVFDERYFLYGVDTTFFLRVWLLKASHHVVLLGEFEHSLSRLEIESKELKRFRRVERGADMGLTLRYYFPLSSFLFWQIAKEICKIFYGGSSISFTSLLSSFVSGRHYRS